MVSSGLLVFMKLNPVLRIDGDEVGGDVGPPSGIEIGDAFQLQAGRAMRVPAEYVVSALHAPVTSRPHRNLMGQPEPFLAEPLQKAAEALPAGVSLLHQPVEGGP